ncbi:hypothetical protein RHSIM_Rhsim02G0206000 [Rhododendron simsii]|uniref:Uncharacterized protein n=1 Tax=Rhododendron simsii TaxID=118357 RepID=A0A834HDH2_RHOSS|nr:hypothetical protein RHSIM_Rhsim02G0206000 [Rhododendron simsii]
MGEQVIRTKRKAAGGPGEVDAAGPVARPEEARAQPRRLRKKTQVVDSEEEEADEGVVQPPWVNRGYVIPTTFPIDEFLRHDRDARWGVAELERRNAQYFFGPFRPILPRLVRLFWQNMYKQDGLAALYTVVDGFHFKISRAVLSRILNCPTHPDEPIFHESVRHLLPHEIVAAFSEGRPTGLGYLRRVDLPARLWLVDSVFRNIFPTSHKDERRVDFLRALYSVHLGVPLDIPGLVLAEMKKFHENTSPRTLKSSMPFAALVTDILTHSASLVAVQGGPPGPFEPQYDEEEDRTPRTMDQTTWRRSLRSLRKSRAVHAAGVRADEESGDDADVEMEAGPHNLPPPFQPAPLAAMPPQVPENMSYAQCQDLVQRQNNCRASVDALPIRSEQVTRSKPQARDGPSEIDVAGQNACVEEANSHPCHLRKKTQVVDSDEEEANDGVLQAQWVSRGYVIPMTFPIEEFLRHAPDARWGIAELERLNAQYFFGPFRPIFPRLVRLFWQNMYKQDGIAALYTVVDGFQFKISRLVLSRILNCPTCPDEPIFHESVRRLQPPEIVAAFSEGVPTGLTYLRRVDLPARLWFVDSVFKNIFPTSHKDERRLDYLRALYSIHLGVPLDIPGLVLGEMKKFHENSSPRTLMPFATLVTDILTHPASLEAVQGGPPVPFEPPHDEEKDCTARTKDQTTWRKSLRSLRKSRAVHAAGVRTDEEGGDDADVEMEADDGPPAFQPPPTTAMLPQAPSTISYAQYQNLIQRQNYCQASVDALRAEIHRNAYEFRGFFHALTGQPPLPPYQPPSYPPFPGAQAPPSDDDA